VLINDIQAHQTSVDTLNDAGRQLVESDKGSDDANTTQQRLVLLNKKWGDLVDKSSNRQKVADKWSNLTALKYWSNGELIEKSEWFTDQINFH